MVVHPKTCRAESPVQSALLGTAFGALAFDPLNETRIPSK